MSTKPTFEILKTASKMESYRESESQSAVSGIKNVGFLYFLLSSCLFDVHEKGLVKCVHCHCHLVILQHIIF